MLDWFNTFGAAEWIYFCIALPSTIILLLQTILALFGIGSGNADADFSPDGGFDGDGMTGGEGLAFFSVRGILSGLCIAGWSGFLFLMSDMPVIMVAFLSLALGLIVMLLISLINRSIARMQASGNINPENAVGKVAQVYMQIPPNASGTGKVNVVVQDRLTEFFAVTRDGEMIKTGESVRVTAVNELGILTVERAVKPKSDAPSQK